MLSTWRHLALTKTQLVGYSCGDFSWLNHLKWKDPLPNLNLLRWELVQCKSGFTLVVYLNAMEEGSSVLCLLALNPAGEFIPPPVFLHTFSGFRPLLKTRWDIQSRRVNNCWSHRLSILRVPLSKEPFHNKATMTNPLYTLITC